MVHLSVAQIGIAHNYQCRITGQSVCVLFLLHSSTALTKAAWALVSVTVSEVPAIMIAVTMAIVVVL